MKRFKVLHIVESLGGGVHTYFIDLCKFFGNDNEFETFIVYSNKRPEIDKKNVGKYFNKKVKLIPIPMSKEISFFKDISSLISLVKTINKLNPDIIHLHSSKISVLGRLAYIITASRSKLFYTPHGYSFLRQDISGIKKKVFFLIEKFMAKLAGNTVACGDTEFEYAKKFGKSFLVRNGVDIKEIANLNTKKNKKSITAGTLGRITDARNPELFNKIALNNPEINFVWIGDGELRKVLSAKNIAITGWYKDRLEGLKKLNEIDIYLQTSLWEGLPLAILEAMAMNKPVIASNIIGNKDIILDSKSGYLCNNLKEFDNSLRLLLCQETRKSFGEKGKKRLEKYFDYKKNFQTLKELYLNKVI